MWGLAPESADVLPSFLIFPPCQEHGTSYPPHMKGSEMPVEKFELHII